MTHPNKGLSADDVRALFSDHLEGTLEPAVQQQVDEALSNDPALSAERRVFEKTVGLLQALPSEEAPANLVGLVRDRLAAERRSQQQAQVVPIDAPRRSPWRTRGVELMVGLAAAAAVVAVVVVGVPELGPGRSGSTGLLTAGGSSATAVSLSWRAPGMARIDVAAAAQQAGLSMQEDGAFVGDRQAAARFLVALKTRAAGNGSDVSGTVPEQAERVVVVVVP